MDFKDMVSKRLEELSLRGKILVSILDSNEYDPEKLEQDFENLQKDIEDLGEKIEKESGIKFDDLE